MATEIPLRELEQAEIAASIDWYDAIDRGLAPGVAEVGGLTAFAVGRRPTSAYLNRIMALGPGTTQAALDTAVAALSHAQKVMVRFPPFAGSALLMPGWLSARGLRRAFPLQRLVLPLDEPLQRGPGVAVELADDPALSDEIRDVVAAGFGVPPDHADQAVTVGRPNRLWAVARDASGVTVGAGMAYVHGEVVYCGSTSVLPAWRRRGVHTALLVRRLQAARLAGARVASVLVEAGGASEASLIRLGARSAYPVDLWTR